MLAYFDANDGNPKVAIEIKGTKRKYKSIVGLLDTGHSGSLSLSVLDLIEIGAKLSSIGKAVLADGSTVLNYYFSVKVRIDGVEKEVLANMIPTSSEAIIGLQLLSPYVALIDFKNKKIKLITEKELSKK